MKKKGYKIIATCFIALLMFMASGSIVMADSIQTGDKIKISTGIYDGYISVYDTSYNWLFETFCIEQNETVAPGVTYTVTINTSAVNGGAGGGNPDPLDARTAWLYYNFRMGTLDDEAAAYSDPFTFDTSDASTKSLKWAIWIIEEEIAYGNVNDAIAKKLYALADDEGWDGTEIGPVRVMNLYTATGAPAQDLLTILPVPEPSLIILLGLGLFGVSMTSRKLRK